MSAAKKMKDQNVSGYTNDSNPFGDSNLNEKFVWRKKIECHVGQGVPLDEFTLKAERKRQKERMMAYLRDLGKKTMDDDVCAGFADLREGCDVAVKAMVCRKWDAHNLFGKYLSTEFILSDPQEFCPLLVMKKWLNIKPQVHDFSEDGFDTETEREDDVSSVKDTIVSLDEDCGTKTSGKQSQLAPQASDGQSRYHELRHKSGKSEGFHSQYNTTKDVSWHLECRREGSGRKPGDRQVALYERTSRYLRSWSDGFPTILSFPAGNKSFEPSIIIWK